MISRAVFILIAVFWITMNVLLWRASFGGSAAGTTVPAAVVWEKILTAPDSSSLSIFHRGKKIGFCAWETGVGEELSQVDDENIPTGLSKSNSLFLQFRGMALLPEVTNRIRFECRASFFRPQQWREIKAHVDFRPMDWGVDARARAQTVRLVVTNDSVGFERTLRFSELRNRNFLIGELLGPVAAELTEQVGLPALTETAASQIRWEARSDVLRVGHTPVPVYRLQAEWLVRYRVVVMTSRVGEIVRMELPDEIVLVNDRLGTM